MRRSALDLERFAQLRPYMYHVTVRSNLVSIARQMRIDPAADLMRRGGRSDLLRWQRPQMIPLVIDDAIVTLPDQAALVQARVSLARGWVFADFIEYLNEHVFLWPGTSEGTAKTGALPPDDHRWLVSVRMPTSALLTLNASPPLFCAVNVRAPRGQEGRRVPRGPNLFALAEDFPRREVEVVEVAFGASVALPASTMCRRAGEWVPLADG